MRSEPEKREDHVRTCRCAFGRPGGGGGGGADGPAGAEETRHLDANQAFPLRNVPRPPGPEDSHSGKLRKVQSARSGARPSRRHQPSAGRPPPGPQGEGRRWRRRTGGGREERRGAWRRREPRGGGAAQLPGTAGWRRGRSARVEQVPGRPRALRVPAPSPVAPGAAGAPSLVRAGPPPPPPPRAPFRGVSSATRLLYSGRRARAAQMRERRRRAQSCSLPSAVPQLRAARLLPTPARPGRPNSGPPRWAPCSGRAPRSGPRR